MYDQHDLGNALAAIIGFADLLASTRLSTEQKLFVQEIQAAARLASERLVTIEWQPDTSELVNLLSQWRGNNPPQASSIAPNTGCSVCGAIIETSDRAVLITDTEQPIPPALLGYALTPGFVTDRIETEAGTRIGIDQVIRALHALGGHLHLRTSMAETRLLVTFPPGEYPAP